MRRSMKHLVLLLTGFLLLLTQKAVAEEYNNIAISGTVHNPSSQEIRIVLYSYVPGQDHISSTARLEGEGGFHFVSYIREAVFARIFYANSSFLLYLEPGYKLHLSFDDSHPLQSLELSGVGAQNNAFLLKRMSSYSLKEPQLLSKARETDVETYRTWTAARKQAQEDLLNLHREELSSTFVALQEADIAYTWANEMFAYASHGQARNKLPDTFYAFMDGVKLHNYEVIRLQSYREFLNNYLLFHYERMKEPLTNGQNTYYSHMYKVARRSLRSLPMYHMQAEYLVKGLRDLGIDQLTDEYIEFANECPLQAYKNVLHQMVKEQTISPKESEIIFTDEKGQAVPLKRLTGNIVLLRFTHQLSDSASRLLHQHDQELKQRLSAYKEVELLQLPMSKNKEAYEKMVYADASTYLKSIMNRPKPGQKKPKTPAFSYILLNRDGLVVSNSLDDPKNELALEKIEALIRQEERSRPIE